MFVAWGKLVLAESACELLGVPLLHHSEAAKLAFDTVIVAVMVGIARDEIVAADPVKRLDLLDHVDGKRNARDPGRAGELIGDIELGRRRRK